MHMKTSLYNLKNQVLGEVEVPEKIFGVQWNPILIQQMLIAHRANARHPWAHTKTRGEIRGGGRKPWRQKGTGRARHGSTRSPLWVGGGVSHGPRNERDYSQKVNKKMKRVALFSILSRHMKDGSLKVFDGLRAETPKTKPMSQTLDIFKASKKEKRYDVLLVPSAEEKNLYRAASNLPKTLVLHPGSLNVYDLMNYKNVFLDREAIPFIEKHYAK